MSVLYIVPRRDAWARDLHVHQGFGDCTWHLGSFSGLLTVWDSRDSQGFGEKKISRGHISKNCQVTVFLLCSWHSQDDSDEEDGPAAKKPRKSCKRPDVQAAS